jgi:AmmeMemoRadiSam system protein A
MSLPEVAAEAGGVSLRELARAAIAHGLCRGRAPELDPSDYPPALRETRASFVTLRRHGDLRGCTGTLEARWPLVCDVAQNAWRSASADPRFAPLSQWELAEIDVSVAVLSPLESLVAESELELLASLRPGVDGLVLREGPHSATFLPAVWQSLPLPADFLDQLRQKAGLPRGYWSTTLRFERYTSRDAL